MSPGIALFYKRLASIEFFRLTPNEGRLTKGFYGRNDKGSYSYRSFITACCNIKDDLSGI